MYYLAMRLIFFIVLAILFIAAIWYRIDYKRNKIKRSKNICILLFTVFTVGMVLGNFGGVDLKSKFVSEDIAEAAEAILQADSSENVFWDYQAKVCAGTIWVDRDISAERISEIKQWGIDEKKCIYGYDGEVYYSFFPDRFSRSSVYVGLPEAPGGNVWLISGNNSISINYYYTSDHWFDVFIAPIFSPEYIYRDKIDLMDIANSKRENIDTHDYSKTTDETV